MMQVTLTMKPRAKPFLPIEAEMIIPMNFIGNRELFVWEGNKKRRLDEVFTVRKEGNVNSPENIVVILRGDTSRVKRVGEYMSSGTITIEGDIGMHCGNFMRGGNIVIHGNADGWLGREMRAGSIVCHGNAGDYCGSCLLYTSDAADDLLCVDLGGWRIIKKKTTESTDCYTPYHKHQA